MNGTTLERPAVRGYIRELDDALAALPAKQSGELKEEILAHLEDALRLDMDDYEVAEVLRLLGPPSELVAETVATTAPVPAPRGPAHRGRVHLPQLSWRKWTSIGVAVALLGSVIGYGTAVVTAPPLQFGGTSSWWDMQDAINAIDTTADGSSQTTVPVRSGHVQGLVVNVYNPSSWAQTVLGLTPHFVSPGGLDAWIGLAGSADLDEGGGLFRGPAYRLPATIPPHQYRALRVLWVSAKCYLFEGSAQGIDSLSLRVRVGWFTLTETISLGEGFFLSGPSQPSSSSSRCRQGP
ncbi:MAG: hypothetical protein ABSD85_07500 [Acidimicrobiales bacterium]